MILLLKTGSIQETINPSGIKLPNCSRHKIWSDDILWNDSSFFLRAITDSITDSSVEQFADVIRDVAEISFSWTEIVL